MYRLTTHASFDSAHFLAGYDGKCSNLHGHRWKLEVTVESEKLEENGQIRGMIVDFGKLKQDVKMLADEFDHCLIVEKNTLKSKTMEALLEEKFKIITVEFRPTAENFAKYFFDRMKAQGYQVSFVNVYETPNNMAGYGEG
ncbi:MULTISPECIES: 6-carboxytetrahydropterin synthase QueD [Anaerostipes]|uniref:6-carboxytetrahydropterin synthase QueD n=1 Tax=Anaerostipes TaxID=207244 RepID=UPI00095307C1|nr:MULTISPECIES: 6-carboxytetrahydropterin synthase QueD [Anaerostipes]MCI5622998.1 6-carboxytetrahydropterin synthase QueD [Anaerostipes sp.]MDY2726082.1 6-carboxytetrahydropterin synthase QueD [Anaerostipes faecalis]OLR58243.1 6-carboxytetrahydropterin synthase QueD [Anaerostipes sp. 494a]